MSRPDVVFEGPLFEGPRELVRANIKEWLDAVVAQGAEDVSGRSPVLTGAFQSGVVGRTQSLAGKAWKLTGVISQTHVYPWPNGGFKQYRGGKLEAKHGMFRKTVRSLKALRDELDPAKGLDG